MSPWYQPQEKAEWWYEKGVQGSTMITGAVTDVCEYDLTQKTPISNTYYVSTTYTYDTGVWSTSQEPPPSAMVTGVIGSNRKGTSHLNNGVIEKDFDTIRNDMLVLFHRPPCRIYATI